MAIDTSAKSGSMLDKPTDMLAKKLAGTHKLWSVADKEKVKWSFSNTNHT